MCKTTDWKDNKSFVGERVLTGSSSPDDEHLQGKKRSGLAVNGAAGSQARRNRPVAARSNVEEEAEAEGGADESGEDT